MIDRMIALSADFYVPELSRKHLEALVKDPKFQADLVEFLLIKGRGTAQGKELLVELYQALIDDHNQTCIEAKDVCPFTHLSTRTRNAISRAQQFYTRPQEAT